MEKLAIFQLGFYLVHQLILRQCVGSKMMVMANNLSIRKSANLLSEKLADLSKGDMVEYISSTNGWNKVRYNGYVGYVSSYYLRIQEKLKIQTRTIILKMKILSISTSKSQANVSTGIPTT